MAIVAARARLAISARNRRIVLLALRKLRGARVDFGEALRALRAAVRNRQRRAAEGHAPAEARAARPLEAIAA